MYQVTLEKFEGPLDLLAQLIETKKLDITEISLAQVTDQFLVYLKNLSCLNPGDLANFLVVASRLALIKSRSLLPFLEVTQEEESEIKNLKEQLAEYYRYRQLAKEINRLDKSPQTFHGRSYLQNFQPIFYFPKDLKAEDLSLALENLISTLTFPQRIPQAKIIDVMPLERKLEEIERLLKEKIELTFSQLLHTISPEEKVVAFLSVLELIKNVKVEACQKNNFEEITIHLNI